MLSFVIRDLTSLNFYLLLSLFMCVTHWQDIRSSGSNYLFSLWNWCIEVIEYIPSCELFFDCCESTPLGENSATVESSALSSESVAWGAWAVINVRPSRRGDAETQETTWASPRPSAVFPRSFLSLTRQEEKHIMRCCCPRGYELSMWQGRVRVCLSVPCSFEECPQSARSSGTPSKPESKYHLSRAAILRGHG